MILTYNFGDDGEEFYYEVDFDRVDKFLIKSKLITKEDIEKLDYELDEYYELYEEDIKDYFMDEARELWYEMKEEEKDPYAYRGISRKDFY